MCNFFVPLLHQLIRHSTITYRPRISGKIDQLNLQPMDRLLNKKEVAAMMGVTVKAIDKWVCENSIPYIKISRKCVRFAPSDLNAYLNKHKIQPPTPPTPLSSISRR